MVNNNHLKNIFLTVSALFLLHSFALSQTETLEGVSITIKFKEVPSEVNITPAPLRYDKDFALSYTMDDGLEDTYTHAFKFLAGGTIDGVGYQPLYYTDGCGNDINFTMSTAIFSFNNNDAETDVHDPDSDYASLNITWPEISEMYQAGWSVINHGLSSSTTGDKSYHVGRNHSYVKYKTLDAFDGGINASIFVNPNGVEEYSTPAFNNGYNAAYRQIQYGVDPPLNVFNIDAITDLDSLRMGRVDFSSSDLISEKADELYALSDETTAPWSVMFNHSVNGKTGGIQFGLFEGSMQEVADNYGKDGLDNIWFTAEENVMDYLLIRDEIEVDVVTFSKTVVITFSNSENLPVDLRTYALSLLIDAGSTDTILSIAASGGLEIEFNGVGDTLSLINFDWDGSDLPTNLELANTYVDSAESTQSNNIALIALDYVNMLDAGTDRDTLRMRLCEISGITMPEGYCDCETSIGNDTTICIDDCVELAVSETSSYLWSTGDTEISIIVCPTVSTEYSVVATNDLGCEARDTVLVTVQDLSDVTLGNDTSICKGECLVLSGGTGDIYDWSTGDTTQTISICPDTTTEYILTISDTIGCYKTDTILVTVLQIDAPIISNDTTICFGECTELLVVGGDSYLWSTAETTDTITVCPNDTIDYIVDVSFDNGCVVTDTITVSVNPLPVYTISNDTSICFGECVDLSVSDTTASYLWNTGEETRTITVCPNDTITYYVDIIGENTCSVSDSIVVNVLPLPELTLSNDTTICDGDCAILKASGSDSYLWSNNAVIDSTIVCPEVTTTYTVRGMSLNGCYVEDSIVVIVDLIPDVDAGSDTTICEGEDITITATGGNTYVWDTGDDSAEIIVAPTNSTTYYVTAYSESGCFATDSIRITVSELPEVFAGNDTIVCPNVPIELEAIGDGDFVWSTEETTAIITIFPVEPTNYEVTITNGAGCQASDEVFVDILESPIADAGVDTVVCAGSCIELTAAGDYLSYEWDTGDETNTIEVCVDDTSVYTVTAYNELGCFDSDYVIVYTYPVPEFSTISDSTICRNDTISLFASGDDIESYLWLNTNEVSDTIEVHPYEPTMYYVQATDENSCTYIDSVFVNHHPITEVTLADILPAYCDNNNEILLEAIPYGGLFEGPGMIDSIFYPSQANLGMNELTYTIVDELGCYNIDTLSVVIYESPVVNIGNDTTLCAEEYVILEVPDEYDSYLWSNGSLSPSTLIDSAGTGYGIKTIELIVTLNGCVDFDQLLITFNDCTYGIDGPDDIDLKLFPNPSKDKINIAFTGQEKSISIDIINLDGQVLISDQINDCSPTNCTKTIDISMLEKGMYLMHFRGENFVKTSRFIVN